MEARRENTGLPQSVLSQHKALTDAQEYFAELSEAYLRTNDFYPLNRQKLLEFDPEGFELVRQVWEM